MEGVSYDYGCFGQYTVRNCEAKTRWDNLPAVMGPTVVLLDFARGYRSHAV